MNSLARRAMIALLVLTLIAGFAGGSITNSAEAGGSWSAWIYHQESGRLVHVFPDGVPSHEIVFPLPAGTSEYPYELAFSRDGAYVAACLMDDAGVFSVRVYDIYNEVFIAAWIASGPLMGCSFGQSAFSEDGSQLAFGVINNYPGQPDPRPSWELMVMEMNTSAILHYLSSDSLAVTALGDDYAGTLPLVTVFQMATGTTPGLIAFKPVLWGTEGAPEYDSLVWNLARNDISIAGPYGKTSLDLLAANGEAIWIDLNESYPSGTLMGPGVAFNVVMYSNKAGDEYPIYNDGPMAFYGATFVDDGRRIVINETNMDGSMNTWKAIDRAGNVTVLPSEANTWDMWGTMDGYVFLTSPATSSVAPQVQYHRFEGGASPAAYTAWTGNPGEYWRMVWATPLTGGAGLPPFAPFGTVGPPPVMTPTPDFGTPTGPISVGMQVEVNTTEGDLLRLRAAPGLSASVLFSLPDGTRVTLIDGPVSADGYNWWRAQTGDGRAGWCVDGVWDGGEWLETLVPWPSSGIG